ncbi:MAG TPA: Crp/Fnr family transcriptional regulator [Sphingomonas sp.]|uniref:Crp/Fnr family transcriptional regulator n=1 Tax=Sphingomonas sp. TaxID=28214 RepID=UPI002EDB409E
MPLPSQSYTSNRLLNALTSEDFALLQPDLQRVPLTLRQVLIEADTPIEHVYFLEGGVGSMIAVEEDGDEIEVGIFGDEGLCGIPVILRAGQTPARALMQIGGGTALRIEAAALDIACRQSSDLQAVLLRFVQTAIIQAAQTAASNAHYALAERLARWLLMCHDRIRGDELELTHEFMAIMLAVRRSSVTVTLHQLEGTRAIQARRGLVTVLDRARLEEIAGSSYGAPEAEYRRLIGPFGRSPTLPS